MFDKLCIKNFKKFDTLELKNLSRVNLFIGDNNVGKTTALEAIFSFSCKNSLPAKITNELPHRGENEVRKIFVALERTGAMNELINETNKTFGVKINGIETTDTFGDGLRRWYYLLGNMLIFPNGIHCIDNVDFEFHQRIYGAFSKQLLNYAHKYNNQLFMTTHNIEYMDTFLETLFEMGNNILEKDTRVITLRSVDGIVKSRTLTGLEALQAREDGVDIRL